MNWTAPNSSYVERDAESQLRGFDDRAEVVRTTDSSGRSMLTIKRDYRDILPALRHRYDPGQRGVGARFRQPHDVHLTIDADLQLRVAGSSRPTPEERQARLRRWCSIRTAASCWRASAIRRASAASAEAITASDGSATTLLDRARYGLYPPGSTFKLVTASAALRQHLDPRSTTFTCARLPDGRVGARINGWNRPVRDDVLRCESARDDRRARRLRAFVQRVLRAARRQARIAAADRYRRSTGDFADAGGRRCGARAPDASADRLRPGRRRRDAAEDGARRGRDRVGRHAARHALRAGRSSQRGAPIGF